MPVAAHRRKRSLLAYPALSFSHPPAVLPSLAVTRSHFCIWNSRLLNPPERGSLSPSSPGVLGASSSGERNPSRAFRPGALGLSQSYGFRCIGTFSFRSYFFRRERRDASATPKQVVSIELCPLSAGSSVLFSSPKCVVFVS